MAIARSLLRKRTGGEDKKRDSQPAFGLLAASLLIMMRRF
jgi:hypothetical protein